MMTAVKFVFGSGWWIAWHAVLLISLVPLILISVSFVNGLMCAGTQPWSWARRYVLLPLGMIVAWSAAIWLIFALTNTTTGVDVAGQTRSLTWWGLVASFAVIYVANLAAMHAVRAD